MLSDLYDFIRWEKDGGGGGDAETNQEDSQAQELDWETWHAAQPDETKELLSKWEHGLKTALDTERDARKSAEKDLRDVAKKLEEGSEAQNEVLKLADQVASSNTQVDFYEEAHKAGVTNLKLAYHVATTEGLIDKRGNVDFEEMKKDFPELFGRKKVTDTSAGDGTGSTPGGGKRGMNEFIRSQAGRK